MTLERTYEQALKIINSRQRSTRPTSVIPRKDVNASVALPQVGKPALKGSPSIVGMTSWLQMIGHSLDDVDKLNIIHIAGTKGKGSTCAFTESFLRAHGRRTDFPRKTGLYTSPHLMYPEERIRIDSRPLSRTMFAKYFFELYGRLPQLAQPYDPAKDSVERGPRSLQLYALLAFHVFLREKVNVSIIETHNGGEYDATNFIRHPIVTAVTTLGMDHVDMLGPTIENIAWHKGGIYKSGTPALSTEQETAPLHVLKNRAIEKGQDLRTVEQDVRLPQHALQLTPEVQRKNASLAVAAAETFLQSRASKEGETRLNQEDIALGIKQFAWPGRFQVIVEGNWTWFLDAAHNNMSVPIAAQWFAKACSDEQGHAESGFPRILIFSHINELRDTEELLETLAHALVDCNAKIEHVIFSTYDESELEGKGSTSEVPARFEDIWQGIHPHTQVWNEPTIQGAIARAREIGGKGMRTLITGSQHLVGPSLRILSWELKGE